MKNRIKTLIVALGASAIYAALSCSVAHAQLGDYKAVSISYDYYGYAKSKATELNPESSEASFQMFKLNLALPITLVEDHTIIIPGLRYTMLDVVQRHESTQRPRNSVDALYTLMLKAALWQRIVEDWAILAAVSGGLASDLAKAPTSEDWAFTAHLLALWTIVPDFTLGAGVGYDRRTGTLAVLPLLAIDWHPSSWFMLRAVLPEQLAARVRAAEWLTVGVEGALEGERYHINSETAGVEKAEVAYSLVKVGLGATVHWNEWFHTRAYGGAALRRRFEVYIDDESQGDLRVHTGPYAGVELFLGPSGWKEEERVAR